MFLYFWMMIQVIGESLPISSSGHVQLFYKLFNQISDYSQSVENLFAFDYAIQSISAFVIFLYFFPRWWQLIIKKPMNVSSLYDKNIWCSVIPQVFLYGFIADGITLLFWLLDLGSLQQFPLWLGFMITTAGLWSLQFAQEKTIQNIWSVWYACGVGFIQGLALFPGISRFASTVTALCWFGYVPSVAFAVSFLLQFPLLLFGSIKGFFDIYHTDIMITLCDPVFLILGICVAFIAYKILELVGVILDKKLLWKFSYYMILPTIIAMLV